MRISRGEYITAGDQKDEFQGFSGGRGPVPPLVIEDALRGDWLDIWYQPKIDLRRKCLAGAEAFVRMHHPQAGLLGPEDFLSALDEDGLTKLIEHTTRSTKLG